ncbi:tyrosine-protein phosphatase [Arthrobacter sp. ATA002]|uniref:tyrosine-protein phosphatase n=1 Tax=Arthrobacter sp. ATA002 TaxID=2991715 RepID=UPI0022A78BA5|nr:tyrosine-protein phosphatase [Arthrobacter sp. ATA002]WAP51029.1 tyrosine-protein phosphatase [Arthrobacter sp. ATA002]
MTITALEGTVNFRDTGGLPLAGGGRSAPGVLYRSDAISALTPRGLTRLAESRIEVIVDLRTPAEQLMAPDRLPARSFIRLNLPLFEGAFTGAAQEEMQRARQSGNPEAAARAVQAAVAQLPTLAGIYTEMLQDGSAVFAETARAVGCAAEGSAALVHCTAGKDRTGVAVALILSAVGVDPAAVVADYRQSEANLSRGVGRADARHDRGAGRSPDGRGGRLGDRRPRRGHRPGAGVGG